MDNNTQEKVRKAKEKYEMIVDKPITFGPVITEPVNTQLKPMPQQVSVPFCCRTSKTSNTHGGTNLPPLQTLCHQHHPRSSGSYHRVP